MANLFDWVNERAPNLAPTFRKHMTEYYAPKNFNLWYYFGSLAILVLVNQIVTGIFLTMNYKTSALEAFNSPRISFVNLSEAMDTATPIMRVPKSFRISVTQVLSRRELIAA